MPIAISRSEMFTRSMNAWKRDVHAAPIRVSEQMRALHVKDPEICRDKEFYKLAAIAHGKVRNISQRNMFLRLFKSLPGITRDELIDVERLSTPDPDWIDSFGLWLRTNFAAANQRLHTLGRR